MKAILFLLVLCACFGIETFAAKPSQTSYGLNQEQRPLVPFRQGFKWGFADTTGKMVITPEYDEIGVLRNGMFTVRKGRKWGIANHNGEIILPLKYERVLDFSGQYPFASVSKSGNWGLIDETGKLVLPAKYPLVIHLGNGFFQVGHFSLNSDKGHFGVFKNGKFLTGRNFHRITAYPNGYFLLEKSRGLYGLLNPQGNLIFKPEFQGISVVSEGSIVAFGKKTNYKAQFFNERGEVALNQRYGAARPFSEGLAAVSQNYPNVKYGFIDTTGKLVIDYKYSEALSFKNGISIVRLEDKYGLIDKRDSIIAPFIYDRLIWSAYPNSIDGKIKIDKNKYKFVQGYFGPNDKRTSLDKYYDIDEFKEGLAKVISVNGKTGYINQDLVEVIPPKYEDGIQFSEGLAAVRLNEKWGFIDTIGKVVIPFKYSNKSEKYANYRFSEGISPVMIDTIINGYTWGKWTYIDKTGKYLSDLYLYYQGRPNPFREGVVAIPVKWNKSKENFFSDPQYMIINKKGERITEELYTTVGPAEKGLIYVCKDSDCGFIDTTGKEVISLQYQFDLTSKTGENDRLSYYFNGLIKAIDPKTKKPIGYFSKSGRKYWQD